MKKFAIVLLVVITLITDIDGKQDSPSRILSWIPNTDKEFATREFNAWFTKEDCASFQGMVTLEENCVGVHYPNEICCQNLTQEKLEALKQQSLQAAPPLQTQGINTCNQKTLDDLLTSIDNLNTKFNPST